MRVQEVERNERCLVSVKVGYHAAGRRRADHLESGPTDPARVRTRRVL